MSDKEQATSTIHLLAGQRPDGQLIYEDVHAKSVGDNCYELITSPIFARGAAKNDVIRMLPAGRFTVEQHNGNLCIRIMAKNAIESIRQRLEAPLAALGAELDYQNERTLVYSISVKAGFQPIEAVLNEAIQQQDAMWMYANVYDPIDGETPLNWWHDYLAQ
jgi:hypothetical protein